MNSYIRTPDVGVTIEKPDYTSQTYRATQTYNIGPLGSGDLIGYTFSEAVVNPDGPFSLTLLPSIDANGKSWLDKVEPGDVVYIRELGKTRYVGIVEDTRMSAKMGDDGAKRSVSITGYGLGGALRRFSLVLDLKLFTRSKTVKSASDSLIAELSKYLGVGQSYGNILKATYDNFMALAAGVSSPNKQLVCGLSGIIDKFVKHDFDPQVKVLYPMQVSLYQTGANNIWDLWSSMVSPPAVELFGYFDGENYTIKFRPNPYSADQWRTLRSRKREIPSIIVTDADMGYSSKEVNSVFMPILPGSGLDLNKAMIADTGSNILQVNDEAWSRYGYREFFPEFRYYKRGEVTNDTETPNTMKSIAQDMADWYRNVDKMLTGTIGIQTIDDPDYMEYPRIGEMAGFMGGEFYIEGAEHSWNYGGNLETKLNVTRGAVYDESGKFVSKIPKVGGILE